MSPIYKYLGANEASLPYLWLAGPITGLLVQPLIGAMSDNIPNYDAVAALPPFGLFPWFFVAPGVLLAGISLGAGRRAPRRRPVPLSDPLTLNPKEHHDPSLHPAP